MAPILSWITFLFVCLVSVQGALPPGFDLSDQPRTPLGALRIALDWRLARTTGFAQQMQVVAQVPDARQIVLSAHLVFNNDLKDVTDGQLLQITLDAHREMEAELRQYGFSKKYSPTNIHLLAIGNEIFLSSSMKGGSNFIYSVADSPVKTALEACQALAEGQGPHAHDGSCGEIMSAHQYFRTHTDQTTMKGKGARDVSVSRPPGRKSDGQPKDPQWQAPCGSTGSKWGCYHFDIEQGIVTIGADTVAMPYAIHGGGTMLPIAGGLARPIDQVATCS